MQRNWGCNRWGALSWLCYSNPWKVDAENILEGWKISGL
jgi:hypothetical protein